MKSQTWPKRLLHLTAAGLVLLLILFFTRPLYLPDTFLIHQIEARVSRATGYSLRIESGRIRILKGMTLRNISLADSTGGIQASIEELNIRYRLLPLLRRRLAIDELSLLNPTLHISTSREIGKQISATDKEVQPRATVDHSGQETATLGLNLTVKVELRQLHVKDGEIQEWQLEPDTTFMVKSGKFKLEGSHLFIRSSEDYGGKIALMQQDCLKVFFQDDKRTIKLDATTGFTFNTTINRDSSYFDLSLNCQPVATVKTAPEQEQSISIPKLRISATGFLSGQSEMTIGEMSFLMDDKLTLQVNGTIQKLTAQPEWVFHLQDGAVNLGWFYKWVSEVGQLAGIEELTKSRELTGRLRLNESIVNGSLAGGKTSLMALLRLSLEDLSYRDAGAGLSITGLNSNTYFEGQLLPAPEFSFDSGSDITMESVELRSATGEAIVISDASLGIQARTEPGGENPFAQVVWEARGPWDSEGKGGFTAQARKLSLNNPLSSPGLVIEGGASLDNLDLQTFSPGNYSGRVSAALDLNMDGWDDVSGQIGVMGTGVGLQLADGMFTMPPVMLRSAFNAAVQPDLSNIEITELSGDVLPYLNFDLAATLTDRRSWKVNLKRGRLDLAEILSLARPLLPEILRQIEISGGINLAGSVAGEIGSPVVTIEPAVTIGSDALSFALPQQDVAGDSISLRANFQGDSRRLTVADVMHIPSLSARNFRTEPYRNVEVMVQGRVEDFQSVKNGDITIESQELGLLANAEGWVDWRSASVSGACRAGYKLWAYNSTQLTDSLLIKGKTNGEFELGFPSDSILTIAGSITADSLSLRSGDLLDVTGLDLEFPLTLKVQTSALGISMATNGKQPIALKDAVFFPTLEQQFPPGIKNGFVRCRKLTASGYQIENLNGIVTSEGGYFTIPHFSFNAYGGRVAGFAGVELGSLQADSIRYQIQLSTESVNSARLPGLAAPRRGSSAEEAEISAYAHFRGQGFKPESLTNLQGGVAITRIGRQVADNLLKFLDPDETDPSIQTYRGYLKRGWGVKVFTFDIKDDFVYASITPSKPPLTQFDMFILSRLIGLGESVTFGRVPLKFFAESAHK